MKIIVASTNPVKKNAVKEAFAVSLSDGLEILGISVDSGVSDQPMDDKETYIGAKNRAENAKKNEPEADFWVGIEGGLEKTTEGLASFTWVYIIAKNGRIGHGKTGTFFLPNEVEKLIDQGKELGEANDIIFSRTNSKQGNGAVGIFTKGQINREEFYRDAVTLALIPFIHPDLF